MRRARQLHEDPSSPVVVFLGAGASVEAGLPISTGITRHLIEQMEAQSETELLTMIRFICDKLTSGRSGQTVDIELLLRTATYLADRNVDPLTESNANPLPRFVTSWCDELKAIDPTGDGVLFRRLLREAKALLPQILQPTKSVKYLSEINRLMNALPKRRRLAPVIFTLNYDLCLEQALNDANIKFTTGFEKGVWTPGVLANPRTIRLFKLHGSLGWVRHPERRIIYDAYDSAQSDEILVESPEINHEIVFAIDNKLQATQPFLWLFQQCAEIVSRSSYIVCIGYSFRDDHVNEIIGQAMASDPSKHLIFVSPSASEQTLEHVRGITFFPKRVLPIKGTARPVLRGSRIQTKMEQAENKQRVEEPFE
jgi:NAD-dependent SIR2 family protein deacetylase